MMKLKKLIALALAGVMTLALFTGCGDKLGDKPDDTLRAEAVDNAFDELKADGTMQTLADKYGLTLAE